MAENIIKFKSLLETDQSIFDEEMQLLRDMYEKGEVEEFLLCYVRRNPDTGRNQFFNYWWGTSSFLILGMVERMKAIINDWIRDCDGD